MHRSGRFVGSISERIERQHTVSDTATALAIDRVSNRRFPAVVHQVVHSRVMADVSRGMWDLFGFPNRYHRSFHTAVLRRARSDTKITGEFATLSMPVASHWLEKWGDRAQDSSWTRSPSFTPNTNTAPHKWRAAIRTDG
jgi:hypothetical protein